MQAKARRKAKLKFEPGKVFPPGLSKLEDLELDLKEIAHYGAKQGEAGSRHPYFDIRTPGREDWLESIDRDRASWEARRSRTFRRAMWPGVRC